MNADSRSPRWFSSKTPGNPTNALLCQTCKAPLLTVVERTENVCRRLACRGPYLQARNAEAEKVEKANRAALAQRASQIVTAQCELDDEAVLVVPAFEAPLTQSPVERLERFEANLRLVMAEAVELLRDPDNHAGIQLEFEHRHRDGGSPLAVINACTTCRGDCCTNGGDHAFLYPRFIAWRLMNEPDESTASLLADYLQRLPAESCAGSCLYQGSVGCVLPREIRGPVCNEFLCTGIVDHFKNGHDANAPTLAVAIDGNEIRRVGRMDKQGTRTDLKPPNRAV